MPQRPQPCSLLFVADPLTGQIEEVVEGVDYGVRKRTNSVSKKGKGREDALGLSEDEKFLRGVRICRDCRPILLCVLAPSRLSLVADGSTALADGNICMRRTQCRYSRAYMRYLSLFCK